MKRLGVCSRCGQYDDMENLRVRSGGTGDSFEHKPYCKLSYNQDRQSQPTKNVLAHARALLEGEE